MSSKQMLKNNRHSELTIKHADVSPASKWFVIFMVCATLILSGCSNRDLDLKTSNCSARIDFNCNCEKDSSILTDTINSATELN